MTDQTWQGAVVTEAHQRPDGAPIKVAAGAELSPDFDKPTTYGGWLYCRAADGNVSWTPTAWLHEEAGVWRLTRDYNANELNVMPGDRVEILSEESRWFWVRNAQGELGWIPVDCVEMLED